MAESFEWIDIRTRQPNKDDTDNYGCVIVWHIYQGVMVTGLTNALGNRFVSHWAHTPSPPGDAHELIKDFEAYLQSRMQPKNQQ